MNKKIEREKERRKERVINILTHEKKDLNLIDEIIHVLLHHNQYLLVSIK